MPNLLYIIMPVCVGTALFLYLRYRMRPETQWSHRVLRRVAELKSRLDQLLHPPAGQRSASERLADELFEKQKRTVSVEALSHYPKIGPKMVESMGSAGIRTLADAEKHANAFLIFKKKIDNVGEAREEAIAAATKQCLLDERERFDSGRSDEGQEYARRVAMLSAAEQEQARAKARECAAIEECLARMNELETLANQVTFIRSLTGSIRGIDSELQNREFPKVEVATAPIEPPPPASPPPPMARPTNDAMNNAVAHLQACCRFALLAARVDGRVAQAERARIRSYLGDQFGSDPVLLRHLDPQLEAAEANLPNEDDALKSIKALTPKAEWHALYMLAQQIIDSGGERKDKETAFLARLASSFEVETATPLPPPPPVLETAKASAAPEPREVLDIPLNTEITADLVRRRYRLLSDQYDPEKAKSLGPEFAAMAEAKRAAVKAAAEALLKPLNEPLTAPEAPPPPSDLRHNPGLDDLFK